MLHKWGTTLKKPRHPKHPKVLTSLSPLFPTRFPCATQQCVCGWLGAADGESAEPTDGSSKVHHVSGLGEGWNLFQGCCRGPENISGELVELRKVWKKNDGRCFGQGSWISWHIASLTFKSSTSYLGAQPAWYFRRARICCWIISPQKCSYSGIVAPSVPMSLWDVRCLMPHTHPVCTSDSAKLRHSLLPSSAPPVPMLETKADWKRPAMFQHSFRVKSGRREPEPLPQHEAAVSPDTALGGTCLCALQIEQECHPFRKAYFETQLMEWDGYLPFMHMLW